MAEQRRYEIINIPRDLDCIPKYGKSNKIFKLLQAKNFLKTTDITTYYTLNTVPTANSYNTLYSQL